MDSDAILTAVNAVESITNSPHTPERSSYRARKAMEEVIHLILLRRVRGLPRHRERRTL